MATIDNAVTPTNYDVRVATRTYEAAAVAQNDVIEMIDVKKGWTVLDVVLDFDNLGANSEVTVGDGGDTDRFITAQATTSAGKVSLNSAADVGRGYEYTADDTIDIKVTGSGAITGTVRLTVWYMPTYE